MVTPRTATMVAKATKANLLIWELTAVNSGHL